MKRNISRVSSLVLSLTMLVSLFTGISMKSYAAPNPDPGNVGHYFYTDSNYENANVLWDNNSIYCFTVSSIAPNEVSIDRVGKNQAKIPGTVNIPATVCEETVTYSITSISLGAFSSLDNLTTVNIPTGVRCIGTRAFQSSPNLSSVSIPEGVTTIENGAFQGCTNLENIVIPSSVTSMDAYIFFNATKLLSVTMKGTVPPTLGDNAFFNNAAKMKIYVPKGCVDTYRSAPGWINYKERIFEEPTPGTDSWAGLQMLINESTSGNRITLTQDLFAESFDEGLVIPDGKNVTIDLNGYVLDRSLDSATDNGYVIKVEKGATLNIIETSSEGDGKITGGNNKGNGGGIYVKGSCTLIRGTISGNKAQNGGGVYVDGIGASFKLQYSSTIIGNSSEKDGGGLYNCGGEIVIYSGIIQENTAKCNGGGIYTGHDKDYSYVSLSSSRIEKCQAARGGAVYTSMNGRFEASSQTISECNASEKGGAVFTEKGGTSTFSSSNEYSNSIIKNCTSKQGGGLYTNGVIGLENATIESCEATENGSGIYLASEGRIFAGKTAKVIDNEKNNAKNNVYIADGGIITLGSGSDVPAPQSGMSIGISMEKPGIFTTNGSETYAGYFSSDDASIILKNIDEGTPDDSSDDYLALGYRVLFETNGGTAVNQEFVIGGQKLTEPQAPTKEDYLFDGWYSDSEFDDEFVFSDSLTSSITLYAKWHRHNFVKVDGQAATTTAPGWKDYYECKDIADACHAYFEDPTGNTPIENIETWKAEGGNGYIAPAAINITASAVSKMVNVEEVIKINGTLKDGDNPIEFVKVYIAVNDKKYLVDTNEDGSFSAMFSSLPVGKYIFNVYYEKDGKKYDTNVTVEVIAPHEHNLVKVDGQVATTTASGWRDYYECKDIENACNKLFEDAEGTVAIDDFATWKAEGGNGYLAPLSKYTILVTSDGNGKAVADKSEAKEKEEITLTAVPAEGYSFDYWETSPKVEITDNKFRMPESSILVMAHFKENEKPVEVYYAPLVADLKANEEGVIEWEAGDSLPLEAVKLLVDKPELSLEFTFTYEGEEHTIFIPAGAFEKYYDVTIPWYGPAWLIQYFEKSEKEVIEYTIVSGDTLNALAEKFKCTVEEILALNPYISDKHWIYPNNKLLIPVQK